MFIPKRFIAWRLMKKQGDGCWFRRHKKAKSVMDRLRDALPINHFGRKFREQRYLLRGTARYSDVKALLSDIWY